MLLFCKRVQSHPFLDRPWQELDLSLIWLQPYPFSCCFVINVVYKRKQIFWLYDIPTVFALHCIYTTKKTLVMQTRSKTNTQVVLLICSTSCWYECVLHFYLKNCQEKKTLNRVHNKPVLSLLTNNFKEMITPFQPRIIWW